VLLIIDNSSAAANKAAGTAYDPEATYEDHGFSTYSIYEADQQGDFSTVVAANTTSALEHLSCSNNDNIVKNTLLASGTYVGAGTTDYPNLKAHQGEAQCDTGPKGETYALGNYLNYLQTPPNDGETASQVQIVYDAISTVVGGARYAVNFGAMVYGSNNKGGEVVYPVGDLSSDIDFQNFLNVLPGGTPGTALLSSETARPQAEALLDAGYYFRGQKLPISGQAQMSSPITEWCQKSYVILVTNGLSNKDDDPQLETLVGDRDGDGSEEAAYGLGTHYLDDVADYLYETDATSLEEVQRVVTNTILAFQADDPLVKRAADASHGRGSYYNVWNANELAAALTQLLTNIVLEADTSFVAPVVPTSPENRTYSGARVYLGFFKPITQKPWRGNLKKYGINSQNQIVDVNDNSATDSDGSFKSTAQSFWSTAIDAGKVEKGGAGEVLLNRNFAVEPRMIYSNISSNTDLTHADNRFNTTNINASDLDVADTAARDALVNYIYGYDAYDEDGDTDTSEKREWILGDVLHSKPQIINYNTYTFNLTNESDPSVNMTMIYAGANDGMLHAFRDCDGKELWAFIPDNILPNLKELSGINHSFFVDASPVAYIYDKDNDGNIGVSEAADSDSDDGSDDKVILVFGQRRGGGAYYALDVTDPSSPKFLWKIDSTTTGFGELGETWSDPQLGKVKAGTADKIVAFVGAGYDNENEDRRFGNTQYFTGDISSVPANSEGVATNVGDSTTSPVSPKGRGVFAFEIATLDGSGVPSVPANPVLVWEFTPATTNSINSYDTFNRGFLNYCFPSGVTVLDTDYDSYADRLYIGDTGGRMWRISAHDSSESYKPYADPDIANWFGRVIFFSNSESDDGRKIFYRPSVTYEIGYIGVYFGTGDRPHPLNRAVTDRIYAVFDRGQMTSEEIDEDDLVNVTTNLLQDDSATQTEISDTLNTLNSSYGWHIKLDQNSGEKILAPALVFNKVAYYTTYTPDAAASSDPCAIGNLGTSRLYAVDYKTAEAVLNFIDSNDSESTENNYRALGDNGRVLRRDDRSLDLGVGIPSGLVVLMPPSGDAKLLIGSGGGLCSEDPVSGGTIFPIYWMAW